MPHCPTLITTAILFALTSLPFLPATAKELIDDPQFQRGFLVLSPDRDKPIEKTELGAIEGVKPAWHLAQWHSKFSIADAKPERLSSGLVKYENEAKSIIVAPPELGGSLTLAVDSRPEYPDGCRVPNHNWPHLLVSQPIGESPSIGQLQNLQLHLEARLLYDQQFKLKNYNPLMHTAQMPLVMIIQNRNQASPGCGDFMWFLVPVYDSRHTKAMPPHIAVDTADPSAKLIYNPGSVAYGYGDENLHDKKWHTIDLDLLPFVQDAFKTAWEKGYLQGSKDLKDYQVTNLIFGWEVTGVNRAAIEFKNLSLKTTIQNNDAGEAPSKEQ